jgi:hypothetical protein
MGKTLSTSPDRGTFQLERYVEKLKLDPTDESALIMVEYYTDWQNKEQDRMQDPVWQTNNLEFDLLSTDWILIKARANEFYAQNLYAAMCNNEFQRNDVWPILSEQRWSCSWRHAGGIVADMLGKGDYIDWYCSGITIDTADDNEFRAMSKDSQEQYLYVKNNYVSEGTITDEVRADLFKLGWLVINEDNLDI